MPRNPGTKKNQHNHKHENGLVGPGKRIAKQKSNGHINGSPKGSVPDDPLPTTNSTNLPMTNQANNVSNSSLSDARHDNFQDPRKAGLKTRDSDSSYDARDAPTTAGQYVNGSADVSSRRTDAVSSKAKPPSEVSHLQIASSILKSSPACDTVAILIFLLALPSIVLTIVQAGFASLTLIPPAGVSSGSVLSLFDVFQGSAGAPSLGTMAVVDALCFGLWFCLWGWAQNFTLDLAQVQIAITLGSGSASKSSSVHTVCFAIVLMLHSVRSMGIRQFFNGRVLPTKPLFTGRMARIAQLLPGEGDFGDGLDHVHWLRSLFAVHIISQAMMAFVRRRVTSTQGSSAAKSSKRTDLELVAGSQLTQESTSDANANTASITSVDYLPPPTVGFKEGKEKVNSSKKKRRQANQVRTRQPFWAAVASTKVQFLREYEQKKGLSKTTHADEGHLESSHKGGIVWVTHVDPSKILFEVSNIAFFDQDREDTLPSPCKPFFIRINGARWHSVALDLYEESTQSDDQSALWSGEISGLAPNCTYTCSFVRAEDDEEFASVLVKTPAILDKDFSTSQAPVSLAQSTRPSSPTTTIKNSIQNAEGKLNDARNRLVKTRRSHKASISKLERDVDSFNTRLKSSSDDTRQRQKLLQAERSIRQIENETVSLNAALDDLEAIPEEESDEYVALKDAFEKQSEILTTVNETLVTAKTVANNDLSCVKNELNGIATRKERLVSRQARLAEQHDRITQANVQGLNEKERKAAESALKKAAQDRTEAEYLLQFNHFNKEIDRVKALRDQTWAELDRQERYAQSRRDEMLRNSGPLTPEGNLPGTNQLMPVMNRPFNFGFQHSSSLGSALPPLPMSPELEQPTAFMAHTKTTLPHVETRPRSGTNRSLGATSDYSVEFEDADPLPPMPTSNRFDGSGRNSSGSSRGHNNGSPGVIGMGPGGGGLRSTHSPGHGQVSTW